MNIETKSLSIIIPCFNETENLSILFEKLLEIQNHCHEIILVDNGSTDDTRTKLEILIDEYDSCIKVLYLKTNVGYGHGLMSGVKKASGEIIAWTHADLQTDPKDVVNAYNTYIENQDYKNCILKGKRKGRGFFDNFFTVSMALYSSFKMKIKLSDINAQPKMFHHSFKKHIEDAPDDFSLDLFLLYKASINNYSIMEYPVNFSERIFGSSKGGGTFIGKIKLMIRTLIYINKLKLKLKG